MEFGKAFIRGQGNAQDFGDSRLDYSDPRIAASFEEFYKKKLALQSHINGGALSHQSPGLGSVTGALIPWGKNSKKYSS